MTDSVDALSPAGVSELATFIIRPPRAQYSRADLGEKSFSVDGTPAVRTDTTLTNERGHKLQASHFRAVRSPPDAPTVVYLHGNGSCRVEATMLLNLTVPYGLGLFAFDFSGSGRSEGEYISLGVWEKYDVETVVKYLAGLGVRSIVLWGHSMGAATALMFAGLCERRPEVKGIILDSPFASFDKLAQSMVAEMPLPMGVPKKFVLTVGVRAIRKIVKERAGFDVCEIDPLSALRRIDFDLPVIFVHGTADAVVPHSHGELLHKHYPCGDKQWISLKNYEHDTPRPEWTMDRAHVFLQRSIGDDGVSSVNYLELLKSRGNVAMLSGRFKDSIYLYTEALNALSESLTNLPFADAVGEEGGSSDEEDNVARRNSSITNFVTNVKRWRSRAHDDSGLRTGTSVPGSRRGSEDRRMSADETRSALAYNAIEEAAADPSQNEAATRSGRFGRQRSWRGRSFVDSIRRCVGGDRGAEDGFAERRGPDTHIDADAMSTGSKKGLSRRSSRSSRSSSRVRLRTRKRDLRRVRRTEDRKDRWHVPEDSLRRGRRGGDLSFKHRFTSRKTLHARESNVAGRTGFGIAGLGISVWELDAERKALALALLGNRSLARRKIGDTRGAIFDAVTCLQLDPEWIRGYLRKAAALREDGKLELARGVVEEGLKREPRHAGLTDLLRSIDEAVEEERVKLTEEVSARELIVAEV